MKNLQQCRSGGDFLQVAQCAERRGKCRIRNGKGSHSVITTERGAVVVPVHNGDLGKGLRRKLVKVFILLGIAALVLVIALFIL